MYPIYTLYNILWLLLSAVAGHGYYTKTCEDELLVEMGTCSVCSCGSGTEHIATESLVVIPSKNAAGQARGEQHPQFFALREMFCDDSAAADHGFRDLAHRVPK